MSPQQEPTANDKKISTQRKTTLKWQSDGELSSIDMARILDKLKKPELTMCDISTEIK
tara:strand:+ start:884 stop:1057 length:174 start_codon:yes stop_codon:yes gene_type:complete